MFVKSHKKISADNLNIVFEKGNFDYNKMRGLIRSCQNNPLQQNTKNLEFIDANKIVEKEKSEEPLLQLADLVSHSLYRCVEGGEFGVIECRYLNEIRDKFYQDKETNKAIGKGIYVVHKLKDLELDEYSHSFLNEF